MNRSTPPSGSSNSNTSVQDGAPNGGPVRLWFPWVALAATFALVAVASFLPDKRLWGVNHLAFYPPMIRLIVLGIGALCFVPPVSWTLYRAGSFLATKFSRGIDEGLNAVALTSVIAFVAMAAFRAKTLLLGDGRFISNSYEVALERGLSIGKYFHGVTVHERFYPGTGLVNYAASWMARHFGATSPVGGVWMLACLVGAAFVAWTLRVARRTNTEPGFRVTMIAVTFLTGAVALFFGYVENYTLVWFAGAAFVYTAWRTMRAGANLVGPAVWFAVAVALHVQALLLAPALVLVFVYRLALRDKPGALQIATLCVAAATAVAAAIASATGPLERFFLPATSMLSHAYVLDILNLSLLLVPLWPFALAIALTNPSPVDPEKYGLTRTLVVPSLLFLLLFRPELGAARDWDLYAFTALGLGAPIWFTIAHRFATASEDEARTLVPPALVTAAVIVFAFVGIGASETRSLARYESILHYDKTNAGYAYESLASQYEDGGHFGKQIETLKNAYNYSKNPRYLAKLGQAYYRIGDLNNAIDYLEQAVSEKPDFDEARKPLVRILAQRHQTERLMQACRDGIAQSPQIPDYYFFLGSAYMEMRMVDEALKAFETCSTLNPPPAMLREINRLIAKYRNDNG